MNRLEILHRLPYPLKVTAASTWGYYLNWWRYGIRSEEFSQAALEHEYMDKEIADKLQEENIARMLHHSATTVPYYIDQWHQRRKAGDQASWEILENWPVLKKDALRKNPKQLLTKKSRGRFLYKEYTSGSTGTPLVLWQSRKTLIRWYALFDARVRQWNHVSRKDNWAIIGGQRILPFQHKDPPFWVWNQAFKQLYLSSYHIAESNIESYMVALKQHQIRYVLGYPSSLTSMARFVINNNIDAPSLEVIFSNAESLSDYQRTLISKAFHCPVINTYGMSELTCGASECQYGSMHLWPEAGKVEIMDDKADELLQSPEVGRIIATGLLNDDMPLIRYETGDRGFLINGMCQCGRNLPMIGDIEGRIDDMIQTIDGRKIGRLDPIFKADIPIQEAQIIQESIDTIRIKFVPSLGYEHDHLLNKRLRDYLGNMNFVLEKVDQIPRGPNGKFKAVISRVKY